MTSFALAKVVMVLDNTTLAHKSRSHLRFPFPLGCNPGSYAVGSINLAWLIGPNDVESKHTRFVFDLNVTHDHKLLNIICMKLWQINMQRHQIPDNVM